jgi:ABC-type sulfate transport system substrate-binding protein
MRDYAIYLHNELALLVRRGNPKHVHGLGDLVRKDLMVFLPNPIDEGIMSTYGKPLLQRRGLWSALSPGADCKACRPVPHVFFTAVHHREIPAALSRGEADAGLVWATEGPNAVKDGFAVELVRLPPEDNLSKEVDYVIGPVAGPAHAQAADAYLHFLGEPPAQTILRESGFSPASARELTMRSIPPAPPAVKAATNLGKDALR